VRAVFDEWLWFEEFMYGAMIRRAV